METANLSLALRNGSKFLDEDGDPFSIDRRRIAMLRLPTCRLVACDPYHSFDSPAQLAENAVEFARRVPPGGYPFDISIACFEPSAPRQHPSVAHYPIEVLDKIFPRTESNTGDQRIALAILCISDAAPIKWARAMIVAPPAGAEESDMIGFGVDIGEACYVDAAAAQSLVLLRGNKERDYQEIIHEFEQQKTATYQHTRCWSSVVIDRSSQANFVTCSTGWGDGFFHSFWGLDARGEVACLVTDFNVLTKCHVAKE